MKIFFCAILFFVPSNPHCYQSLPPFCYPLSSFLASGSSTGPRQQCHRTLARPCPWRWCQGHWPGDDGFTVSSPTEAVPRASSTVSSIATNEALATASSTEAIQRASATALSRGRQWAQHGLIHSGGGKHLIRSLSCISLMSKTFSKKCLVLDMSETCLRHFSRHFSRHLLSLVVKMSPCLRVFGMFLRTQRCSTESTEFLQVGSLIERRLQLDCP